MIKRKRYNLTTAEKVSKAAKNAALVQQKEKVYVDSPWTGSCDNSDHPRFTISVTVDKPWSVCYYCSKMWILKKDN